MALAMSRANENRKPQLSGISSFCRTSLRLPFGQYSVRIAILGGSTEAPINLQRFG